MITSYIENMDRLTSIHTKRPVFTVSSNAKTYSCILGLKKIVSTKMFQKKGMINKKYYFIYFLFSDLIISLARASIPLPASSFSDFDSTKYTVLPFLA